MSTAKDHIEADIAGAATPIDHGPSRLIGSTLGQIDALSDVQNAPVDTTGLQDRLHSDARSTPSGPTESVQVPAALLVRVRQAIGEGGDQGAFVVRAISNELQRQGF